MSDMVGVFPAAVRGRAVKHVRSSCPGAGVMSGGPPMCLVWPDPCTPPPRQPPPAPPSPPPCQRVEHPPGSPRHSLLGPSPPAVRLGTTPVLPGLAPHGRFAGTAWGAQCAVYWPRCPQPPPTLTTHPSPCRDPSPPVPISPPPPHPARPPPPGPPPPAPAPETPAHDGHRVPIPHHAPFASLRRLPTDVRPEGCRAAFFRSIRIRHRL
jgi:hypothetical protein